MKTAFAISRLYYRFNKKAPKIIVLALGTIITFTAAINAFHMVSKNHTKAPAATVMEEAVLERALDDFRKDESGIIFQQVQKIQIYNQSDDLIMSVEIQSNESINNQDILKKIRKAEFLMEHNGTFLYKIFE